MNLGMDCLLQESDYQASEELLSKSQSQQDSEQSHKCGQFLGQDYRSIPVDVVNIQLIEQQYIQNDETQFIQSQLVQQLDQIPIPEQKNKDKLKIKRNRSLEVERVQMQNSNQKLPPKRKIIRKDKKTQNPQTKQKKLNQNRPHLNQPRRSNLFQIKEPQQQTTAHKNMLNFGQRYMLKQLNEKIPSLKIQLSTENKEKYQRVKEQKANVNNINTLLTIEQFKPIWEEYFKNKKINTDLEESRVWHENKKIFRKALRVFKVAFERKEFKGIRYLLEEYSE